MTPKHTAPECSAWSLCVRHCFPLVQTVRSSAGWSLVLSSWWFWRGWSNDRLSHWSWELGMWMMDWATPAAACEKSDFVQISCSRQPLPRLLHHPVFQAVSAFLMKTHAFSLASFLPSLPPSLLTCLLSIPQLSPLLPFLLFLNCLPHLSLFLLLVYFFESFFV